ncbi:MAG: DNA-binding protein WhiA [Synergistaceae bacterium]|nr:DNA-binding protein WhiA [Synergistaceae bacterium]
MEGLNHTIWDEWGALAPTPPVRDEAAGIMEGLSRSVEGEEQLFSSSRLFTVRRLMRIWNDCGWKSDGGIRLVRTQGGGRIVFAVDGAVVPEIFSVTQSMSRRRRNWNWVRGIFGSCGALYLPRAGYYLAMRPPLGSGAAERLQSILRSCGFALGVRKKTGCRELMLRDQQQIVTFLSRIGLVKTALDLEETAIYRSMRNHANKLVNCDAANINKSLGAAREQMALINKMDELGMTEELPAPLRELIIARKKNPSVSLKELGQSLPTPISKSTVEYRWRKLENMLKQQSKGDDANVLGKGGR